MARPLEKMVVGMEAHTWLHTSVSSWKVVKSEATSGFFRTASDDSWMDDHQTNHHTAPVSHSQPLLDASDL